jgi:hypothetical protein
LVTFELPAEGRRRLPIGKTQVLLGFQVEMKMPMQTCRNPLIDQLPLLATFFPSAITDVIVIVSHIILDLRILVFFFCAHLKVV